MYYTYLCHAGSACQAFVTIRISEIDVSWKCDTYLTIYSLFTFIIYKDDQSCDAFQLSEFTA